jgi:hypothetical protein
VCEGPAFEGLGVTFRASELTKSQLYEAMEPPLNAGSVRLLDVAKLEEQLLSLIWRGAKIDHPSGEHDDASNACAGAIHAALLAEPGGFVVAAHTRSRISALGHEPEPRVYDPRYA